MEEIKEKNKKYLLEAISLEGTEEIVKQMRSKVCKISIEDNIKGTGFFCKIPYPDKNNLLPVLISSNNIIDESRIKKEKEIISILINNDEELKEIELCNRIKYTNKEYNITIIEIKEIDKINNYLELDEDIINGNNKSYIGEPIYILHYPKNKNIFVSYGIIKEENEEKNYKFNHLCCTGKGSSGSPLLNISNNKLIGMHIGENKENNIGLLLRYAINDFINKKILEEFNKKYNLNIKDMNTKKLLINRKWIGNEGLKYLCEKMNFKELKELNLNRNNISDIKVLENKKFNKLEKLYLGINEIANNFNILENVIFRELKELNLSENKISDIKALENVKFEKLRSLDLSNNKITNINVFEKVNFKELKELNLSENKISDIKVLEKVKLEKIEKLNLSNNELSNNINILEKANFKELKELYLYKNNISDIKVLEKVKFEKLEKLNLGDNKISNNIKILENVNFKGLKELYLYKNNISEIKVLATVKFEKLEKLDLSNNEISNNINILEIANFKELRDLNLNNNNISDIKVLEKVKFENLEKLNLGYNKISNIYILQNVNLKELKKLNLNFNNISNIKVI